MLRKIDKLGRIVIPMEYRQALHIKAEDEIEIDLKANKITIRKPVFGCAFCNVEVNLVRLGDLCVCQSCVDLLYKSKEHVLFPMQVHKKSY